MPVQCCLPTASLVPAKKTESAIALGTLHLLFICKQGHLPRAQKKEKKKKKKKSKAAVILILFNPLLLPGVGGTPGSGHYNCSRDMRIFRRPARILIRNLQILTRCASISLSDGTTHTGMFRTTLPALLEIQKAEAHRLTTQVHSLSRSRSLSLSLSTPPRNLGQLAMAGLGARGSLLKKAPLRALAAHRTTSVLKNVWGRMD